MDIQMHRRIKKVIKDLLKSEKEKYPCPSIRMSDIANLSTNFDISPFDTSTIIPRNVTQTLNDCTSNSENQNMNNMKTVENHDFLKDKNNHSIKAKNNNDYYSKKSDISPKHENRPVKLKVVIKNNDQTGRVMNVLNDLTKTQSPIVEKNSVDFVTMEKENGNEKGRKNRPIMGRSALLKKANIETNDSLIIYDLITEKYSEVITHYLDRSTRRRRLRTESSDSDTVYSSPPVYSPLSLSSISTPGSMGPDEKTGFRWFPTTAYSSIRENKFPKMVDDVAFSSNEALSIDNFRFIASTDDTNRETTIEDVNSSVNLSSTTENSNSSFSEYDPKKFLDNAIGELTNTSVAYGIPNGSEGNKSPEKHKADDSIGTSNLSTLISRTSSVCVSPSSKTNTTKSPIRCPTELADIFENKRLSFTSDNSYLEHLMKALSLQNEIMFQVSKAITYCKATKKFQSSIELLEAERILLLASCTKDALLKEIQNVENETYEQLDTSKSCGEVMLSDLVFPPKDGVKSDGHRDFTEHFVIIFVCGGAVLASEIVTAEDDGTVHVKRKFNFSNLAADFEISVCIYVMRIGLHSHQDQKTNCPSPKKIFFHLKKGSKKCKVLNDVVYIKPSSFTLWGRCEIRSRDLTKTKNNNVITLNMLNTPLSASIAGTFSVKIRTGVKLTSGMSGFLTIGTDNEHGSTIWNTRWCVLDGSILKYWNYPSEEVSEPLGFIDLSKCLEQEVCLADRRICARPRTLMLPIKQNDVEKKYLLSADSCSSLGEWEKELNEVVCSLRLWNSIDI